MDPSDYPDGHETDSLDVHSVHYGVFDHNTRLIGLARLIRSSCEQFPVEKFGGVSFTSNDGVERHRCAEISRFMISRHRVNNIGDDLRVQPMTRRISPVFFALYKAIRNECLEQGIEYCFAFMERVLFHLTRLYGLHFEPVGPEINYYGRVRAYRLDVKKHEENATPHRLLEIISDEPCFA